MTRNKETTDIIIPVYKPDEDFGRLLDLIRLQTRPANKIIVIETIPEKTETDGKAHKNVRTAEEMLKDCFPSDAYIYKSISASEFDHAGTRKYAASLSKADAFICMTDDAVPENEYLIERLMDALYSDERIAIAYARQLARPDADETEQYIRDFNYPDKSMIKSIGDIDRLKIKTFFASNVCCAYKKSIYDKLGGFTDNAVFNEDMIYASKALRNGYLSFYAADARVLHSHNYTPMQQLHRNFDLGLSQAMHPEVFGDADSEGEGLRMIKKTAGQLIKKGLIFKLPALITASAFKYTGYRLGRSYKKLPKRLVYALSMNKQYVKRYILEK